MSSNLLPGRTPSCFRECRSGDLRCNRALEDLFRVLKNDARGGVVRAIDDLFNVVEIGVCKPKSVSDDVCCGVAGAGEGSVVLDDIELGIRRSTRESFGGPFAKNIGYNDLF